MANEIVQRGIVARALRAFGVQGDGNMSGAAGARFGKYGEIYALTPGSPKSLATPAEFPDVFQDWLDTL